jgi:DNA processing protein
MELAEKTNAYTITDEKIYQVALSMVPHVGGAIAKQLINYCGSASEVFKSKNYLLQRIPGVGSKIAHAIKNSDALDKAYQEVEICQRKGIQIIAYTDPDFPFRLKQIYDVPTIIYYKGTADLDHPRIVSIVGTRQATTYGRKVVEELITALASYNVLIMSGLAYGIDICAHRVALSSGLSTIGVIASGMNIIYPAVHKKEAVAMLHQGGLLTEHPLGSKPDAGKFPARNRLIAGLADATVVVEAAETGGALITANLANDYNREVFAVPGGLYQPYSKGCNNLIKNHKAHILTKAEDLLMMLGWDQQNKVSKAESGDHHTPKLDSFDLDEREKAVMLQLMGLEEGMVIDDLSWKTNIPIYQLASVLLQLEFKSLVKVCPGKKFKVALDGLVIS